MELLFTFAIAVILGIPTSIVNGWALSTLWGWFVKPVFTNLPALSLLQSVGIMLTVTLFQITTSNAIYEIRQAVVKKDSSEIRMIVKSSSRDMFAPAFVVAVSWMWHTFLM